MLPSISLSAVLLPLLLSTGLNALPQPDVAVTLEVARKSQEFQAKNSARRLTGKFLHITDIHPDPFYKVYSSTEEDAACHYFKGPAGYYGAETSGCDSPIALVNATFDWLKNNLRDEVDFVIWTGDSARHDNDEKIPRSTEQVTGQNKFVVQKFLEAFGKPENWDDDDPTNDFVIPIVPTLGNNDILPHNIFEPGPNPWTARFLEIWKSFIPEAQRHQFQRGGWFSVEVIPGKLEVFSLNTLYFFASNSIADGCSSKDEPGYEQFEWLRIQLESVRARGMKAILMGHVPPARVEAKVSWVESCWQKYALWMRNYRDVVVGGLYGHMNIDHFMLQDWEDVSKHVRHGKSWDSDDEVFSAKVLEDEFTIQSAADYLDSLRDLFAKIPLDADTDGDGASTDKGEDTGSPFDDIGGEFGERYSVTMVNPSVVPNYFPTIRVFSYNISGLENLEFPAAPSFHRPTHDHAQTPLTERPHSSSTNSPVVTDARLELRSLPADEQDSPSDAVIDKSGKKHKHKKPKHKKPKHKKPKHKKPKHKSYKFTLPKPPSATSPPGPAYSPQPLSLLSFTQYFANLTYINNDYVDAGAIKDTKWKSGKHRGKTPPKKSHPSPRNFTFEVEYDTAMDDIYGLKDLSVRSWLDLASKIARGNVQQNIALPQRRVKKNLAWYTFVQRAFVGTVEEEDIKSMGV